jgi:hypothetical protein
MNKWLAVPFLFAGCLVSPVLADCRIQGPEVWTGGIFTLDNCDGCEFERYFVTTGNAACRDRLAFLYGVRRIAITVRPHNGKAGTSENSYAYQPNPGFVGEDRFTVRVEYLDRVGKVLSSRLNVRVVARP